MSVVNTNQRQKIVIVNTGCANISSVRFALERLERRGEHSSIANSTRIRRLLGHAAYG